MKTDRFVSHRPDNSVFGGTATAPAALERARGVSRRSFLQYTGLGAAGLAGSAALAACASDKATTSSAATTAAGKASYGKVSLQLSWIKNIEFAGEFNADSKGYYTAAGFSSVDLITGPVDSADALVAAGTVDIGLSAPDATARVITEQGVKLKIIGATFQKNPFCILSMVEGKPIRTPADLKGKNIGIQAGTNQTIFDGFLKANNIAAKDVTQTVVQYSPTPLQEKKVDGFMAYLTNEPFIIKAAGFTPVTLSFADNGLPLVAETFTVTDDTLKKKRPMLKAFLKAEIQGWNDAVASGGPAASAAYVISKYNDVVKSTAAGQTEEAQAQALLISTADTKKNGLFTLTDDLISGIIKALGEIGITITAADLFDMSLLKEVYAENPDLIKG